MSAPGPTTHPADDEARRITAGVGSCCGIAAGVGYVLGALTTNGTAFSILLGALLIVPAARVVVRSVMWWAITREEEDGE